MSSKGIVYSKADYSLKELYDNMDILSDVMDDYGLNSISLYQRSNSLHVTYDSEYTEKQLLEIIKNIGVPNNMVTVEKTVRRLQNQQLKKHPTKSLQAQKSTYGMTQKNGVQRSVLTHTSTQLVNTELLLQVTL